MNAGVSPPSRHPPVSISRQGFTCRVNSRMASDEAVRHAAPKSPVSIRGAKTLSGTRNRGRLLPWCFRQSERRPGASSYSLKRCRIRRDSNARLLPSEGRSQRFSVSRTYPECDLYEAADPNLLPITVSKSKHSYTRTDHFLWPRWLRAPDLNLRKAHRLSKGRYSRGCQEKMKLAALLRLEPPKPDRPLLMVSLVASPCNRLALLDEISDPPVKMAAHA